MSDIREPGATGPFDADFLSGGGEMGAFMRARDWTDSSLGPPDRWPQALRTAVRLILNTGHPMYIWWGPQLACLYNDAYSRSIGPERHPVSLGRPAREVWAEIWDVIGPQIEQVISGGGATWNVNHLVPITRHGRRDEVYWTYSYSPIDDRTAPNGIGGVLVVCTETTEQVQTAQRLRALAAELTDSNRLKDEFLATLAHELRNPLAPIRNALELIELRSARGEPLKPSAFEVIGRQVNQLVRLVDDLLDLSRISRGLIELRRAPLSLAGALADAVETSRPLIEAQQHQLSVELPDEDLTVDADSTRLVQVVANLLNNAAKFTPRGGRIRLRLAREGNASAVISVHDNGMGIPPEMLDHVFDLFTQVDRSHAQVGGGLGIGLTLVRRLVEMHAGRVSAHSDGPGTGSEFRITLPLRAAPAAHPAEARAAVDTRGHARRRILIADDNVDAAEMLSTMLELWGHETRIAHDGAEALDLARTFRPDAMVVDIAMPRLNGHELARRVRSESWGRKVLLIAASGWGQEENKQGSLAAGFDHHLVKPIEFERLERLLGTPPS